MEIHTDDPPAHRPHHRALLQSCPALVLNADYQPLSYMPLSLWSWQDSVKAVFLDRVVVVETYSRTVRSASNLVIQVRPLIFWKLPRLPSRTVIRAGNERRGCECAAPQRAFSIDLCVELRELSPPPSPSLDPERDCAEGVRVEGFRRGQARRAELHAAQPLPARHLHVPVLRQLARRQGVRVRANRLCTSNRRQHTRTHTNTLPPSYTTTPRLRDNHRR